MVEVGAGLLRAPCLVGSQARGVALLDRSNQQRVLCIICLRHRRGRGLGQGRCRGAQRRGKQQSRRVAQCGLKESHA